MFEFLCLFNCRRAIFLITGERPAIAIRYDRDRGESLLRYTLQRGSISNGDSRSIFTWHWRGVFQRRDGGARQLPTRVRNYFKSAQPVRALRRPPRDMFPRREAKSFLPSSREERPFAIFGEMSNCPELAAASPFEFAPR